MRQLTIAKQITDRESISIEMYLSEISKIDMINFNEEVELARRIRKGDQLALDKLIKANLRFVVSVAKQFQNQGISLSDLINEGNLGLITAAQRYDETYGFKFMSYGVWWIRQSILQALAEQTRVIRLPLNRIASITKIKKIRNQLEQEYEREPTFDEVALSLKTSSDLVEDALIISLHPVSIDAPAPGEENNNFYDLLCNEDSISPDKGLMYVSLCIEIERSLCYLKEQEALVIRYFFGLSNNRQLSLNEIGEKFNLNRERIRHIKVKAINKMRISGRNKLLRAYL